MSARAMFETLANEVNGIHEVLENILTSLRGTADLRAGEVALVAMSELFQLPWAYWVLDTSSPYVLPAMDSFARGCGWPDELLELWKNRHAGLKMPLYIRCRSERFPFMASPSKKGDALDRVPSEQARIAALIKEMGVTTFLVVPLHLPKGQVATIVWAGSRARNDIYNIVKYLEGDLLAIGHHFMRIANNSMDRKFGNDDEQSWLTPREWDCMRTLAQGYREFEVARLIGISRGTTRFHLDNAVRKFGCKTRTQAVALLAQLGLLGPIGQ